MNEAAVSEKPGVGYYLVYAFYYVAIRPFGVGIKNVFVWGYVLLVALIMAPMHVGILILKQGAPLIGAFVVVCMYGVIYVLGIAAFEWFESFLWGIRRLIFNEGIYAQETLMGYALAVYLGLWSYSVILTILFAPLNWVLRHVGIQELIEGIIWKENL